MKNKKTLIMSIIIVVLLVAVSVMGVMLITQNKDKERGGSETVGQETDDHSAIGENKETTLEKQVQDDNKPEEEAPSKDTEKSTGAYRVKIGHENTWEAGGKSCATENIDIYNNSGKAAADWTLVVTYKSEPEIEQIWNGNKEIEGKDITITPVSYNKEIPANSSINIGYNISADDLTVLDYKLFIDGVLYTGDDFQSEAKDTEGKEEAKTEEVTEEKTEAAKQEKPDTDGKTPFDAHGKLSVSGTNIVDKNGDKMQLKGVSTHGITWFPDYVNKDAFKSIRDDWSANLVRIAMYTDTGDSYGYCSGGNKDDIMKLVDTGVNSATELGMYVIVDWHILNDNDPNKYTDESKDFFNTVSKKYADYGNVLYEICNEPNGGTTWDSIKSYAEQVIPVIRQNDKDAIIIVGTPNWSQDVDIASNNPITGYDNIMYAVHFYAATHKENIRSKVTTALSNNLPIFVSEFSLCDASGNGAIDYSSSDEWFKLINENNLSYASWSLCNKNETSALIRSDSSAVSGFTDNDLTDTAKYVKKQMLGN